MSFSAFLCVLLVPGIFGQSLIPDRKPNVIDLDEAIKTIFTTPPNPSFLDEYEEVKGGRVKNGETFGAMPKCGEGEDRGVHICVPYYLCNPKNNTVTQTGVTDGFGVIEIRFGYNSCNHPLEVCCSVPRNTQNNGKLYTSPEIKINTRPSATTSTLVTTTPLTSPFRRTRPLNTLFVSNNISFANTNQTNETLTSTTIINDPSTLSTTASTPLTRPTFRSHRIRLLTIRPSKLFPSIRRIANLSITYVSKDVNKTKSTTTSTTTTPTTTTEDGVKTTTTENTNTVLNTTPFNWQKSRSRSTQRPTITPSQYQVVEENDLPSESDLTLNREITTITTPPIGPTQPLFTPSIKSSRRRNFVCGIRHPDGIDFKLTGNHNNEAEYGEFPWMTAILRRDAVDTPQAICGGSLITPNVVLTGAHCVYTYEENEIKIRVGEWDTQTENERLPYQERNVTSIVLHDDFDSGTLNNDIALLILDRSVKEADNVGTVCLPPQDLVFDSKECFASGWGKDVFGKLGQSQVILKKIQLPIVSRRKCQYSLRKTRLGKSFNLHESFICAGGEEGKDTCTGDGGSPLVCPDPLNPERYFQAGVVAWGIGCGTRNVPGVYADVSHFRNWIDKQLQKLEIDIRAYLS